MSANAQCPEKGAILFLSLSLLHCNVYMLQLTRHTAILTKKISYRRGTARRAVLVNWCYASRGVGVKKVSNSKGDP